MEPIIFQGDLYWETIDGDGNRLGLDLAGNAIEMGITNEVDRKAIVSRGRTTGGQKIGGVTRLKGTAISIKGNTWSADTVAMVNHGDAVVMDGAGGDVTDEPFVARHDKWVPFDHRVISAETITDSTGTTTYVLNTDYELNTRLGMIKALSTGTMTDGQSCLADYTWAAESGHKVVGASKQVFRRRLFFDGINLENDKDCYVTVFDARLAADGAFDPLKEEHQEWGLSGDCLTPTGESGPYEIEYKS